MKVDFAELYSVNDSLKTSTASMQAHMSEARASFKKILSSDELKGGVKEAINQKITNKELPILDDLYDTTYHIADSFQKLIQSLQSALSEHSKSAVIDSQVLEQLSKKIDTLDQQIEAEVNSVNNAMQSAQGLGVSLTTVKSNGFKQKSGEAKKILQNIKNKLVSFNSHKNNDIESDIQRITRQLGSVTSVGSLSYTDPKSLAIYSDTDYKTTVKKEHEKISRAVLERELGAIAEVNKDLTMDDLISMQNSLSGVNKDVKSTKTLVKDIEKALKIWLLGDDGYLSGRGDKVYLRQFNNEKVEQFIMDLLGVKIAKLHGKRKLFQWGKKHIRFTSRNGDNEKEDTKNVISFLESIGIDPGSFTIKAELRNLNAIDQQKVISKHIITKSWNSGVKAVKSQFKKVTTFGISAIKDGVKEFKAAKGYGKVLPGVNIALDTADVVTQVSTNGSDARKQGLKGGEVVFSQGTGAAIDIGKVATESAVMAGVSSGVAMLGLAVGVPTLGIGALTVVSGMLAVSAVNAINDQLQITKRMKKFCNSFIKGGSRWLKSL